MNYEEFLVYVSKGIEQILSDEKKVSVRKVIKNNGIELDALTIMDPLSNISPTIYLNTYYEDMKKGKEITSIIREILALYEEHKDQLTFNVEIFKDFSKVKNRIVFKIINQKRNQKMLRTIPHIKVLDLAVVFYYLIESEILGSATALIYNSHLDLWGIQKEELYQNALKNTPKLLAWKIQSMDLLLEEMLEEEDSWIPEEWDEGDNEKMYVLSNRQNLNGAACILYKDILKNFCDKIQQDVYIIPSSVHEVILLPMNSETKKEEINQMIQEVNNGELDPGEILSDHVYWYSRKQNEIVM